MSAVVHPSHGGDAGSDPPPNPNRVPTSCEQSIPRKRGISRSANLEAAFNANGQRPLPVSFDKIEDTYKAVGDNGSMFIRYIGNLVGTHIPPYYQSWDDVPQDCKMRILPGLEHYFILDRNLAEWPMILAGIERECQDRYRDRKARYKRHFRSVGGYDDVATAKKKPPSSITDVTWWGQTVDFFVDPKNRIRAQKNSQNRSNVKYPSLHGSSSYVASRYRKRNREMQELPSSISHWQHMHQSPTGEWVNEAARLDHERMLAEYTRRTQAAQSTPDGESLVNEAEIIAKVLGERRGHNTGRGRKLKGIGVAAMCGLQTSQATMTPPPSTVGLIRMIATQVNSLILASHNNVQTLLKTIEEMRTDPNVSIPPLQHPQPLDVEAMIVEMASRQPQQPPSNDDGEKDHSDEETSSRDD